MGGREVGCEEEAPDFSSGYVLDFEEMDLERPNKFFKDIVGDVVPELGGLGR